MKKEAWGRPNASQRPPKTIKKMKLHFESFLEGEKGAITTYFPRFGMHFGSILDAQMPSKSHQKCHRFWDRFWTGFNFQNGVQNSQKATRL